MSEPVIKLWVLSVMIGNQTYPFDFKNKDDLVKQINTIVRPDPTDTWIKIHDRYFRISEIQSVSHWGEI